MAESGFAASYEDDVEREVEGLGSQKTTGGGVDLRDWLWSSIDNRESRDLDQIEYAERAANGDIRLWIGIADVDALVGKGSAIDRHAAHNTTSVYTGVDIFPMLPEALSTDRTSLLDGQDRLAMVGEFLVNESGDVGTVGFYPALVRNHAKLDYDSVGDWLEGDGPIPEKVAGTPDLEKQLMLQDEAMERLYHHREKCGALNFETIEARVVLTDGKVTDLDVPHKNRARALIENFMIAANTAQATFLADHDRLTIQRIVREPERWPRIVDLALQYGFRLPEKPDARSLSTFLDKRREADPIRFPDLSLSIVKLMGPGEYVVVRPGEEHFGHFGLAVTNYTHSTAPNRRFPDLVTQRILKSVLSKQPAPYSAEELEQIAANCTEREDAARKVERRMRKAAAAVLLADRIGERFEAIVTGAGPKGTYVRVLKPPVEGRVMRGERGMDVGDRVFVRLVGANPERGFIDFERA